MEKEEPTLRIHRSSLSEPRLEGPTLEAYLLGIREIEQALRQQVAVLQQDMEGMRHFNLEVNRENEAFRDAIRAMQLKMDLLEVDNLQLKERNASLNRSLQARRNR